MYPTILLDCANSGHQALIKQAKSPRDLYGLDKPMIVQYWKWSSQFIKGDFGVSMLFEQPVTKVIGTRLWMTVIVTLGAIMLTWVIALPIGVYSAIKQYSWGDYTATFYRIYGLWQSQISCLHSLFSILPLNYLERQSADCFLQWKCI